jgi:hypothetical protein
MRKKTESSAAIHEVANSGDVVGEMKQRGPG